MVSATAASTANQNPPHDPSMVGMGFRSTPKASTTSAMTTSTDTYLRSTRMEPSGQMVRAVVTVPAASTHAHRGRCPPVRASSPAEITSSSNTAQPRHCAMFNTAGTNDAFAPSRPRSNTMAGAPVFAPSTSEAPRISPPSIEPTTIAVTAAGRLSGPAPNGVRIDRAPAKPSRLTPRFPQKPSWSSRPRVRGAGWVSVIGASDADGGELPGSSGSAVVLLDDDVDMARYLSLRRYEPDQVQAVGGPLRQRFRLPAKPPSQPGWSGSRGDGSSLAPVLLSGR